VRYLAVQTGQQTVFASGDLLPLPEGGTLKDPQGQVAPAGATASQPGFYLAFTKAGAQDFCYAVNGSGAEADPATISEDEIVAAIEPPRARSLAALTMALPANPPRESRMPGCGGT